MRGPGQLLVLPSASVLRRTATRRASRLGIRFFAFLLLPLHAQLWASVCGEGVPACAWGEPFRPGFTRLPPQLCTLQPRGPNPGALHPPEVVASLGSFKKTPLPPGTWEPRSQVI